MFFMFFMFSSPKFRGRRPPAAPQGEQQGSPPKRAAGIPGPGSPIFYLKFIIKVIRFELKVGPGRVGGGGVPVPLFGGAGGLALEFSRGK